MATTNYGWIPPTVGASEDTWGTILNTALEAIDTDLKTVDDAVVAAQADADTGIANAATAQTTANAALPKAGGTMTGPLIATQASTPSVTDSISGGTLTIDCSDSNVFKVAVAANITTLTLSNPDDGQTINIRFTIGGAGGYTASWPASFKWAGGSAGVLSTGVGDVDLLVATYFSDTGVWLVSLLNDMS